MNCEPIRGLLSAYLDDQLSASERQSVNAHLDICIECSAILSDYYRFDALLARLPYLTPPSSLQKDVYCPNAGGYHLSNAAEHQKAVLTLVPLALQHFDTPVQTDCYTYVAPPSCVPHHPPHQTSGSKHLVTNITIMLLLSTIGFLLIQYFYTKKASRPLHILNFGKIPGK